MMTPTTYPTGTGKLHLLLAARARGFTLIEVLVALLILAIGVLGIVALQYKGLKYSHDANLRSQINFLAYDISDRMRLNRNNAADYVTDPLNPYTVGIAAPATACVHTTASDASNDLACWHQQIYQSLPPDSTATISGPASDLYTVSLAWTDREGQTHTINYTFQP